MRGNMNSPEEQVAAMGGPSDSAYELGVNFPNALYALSAEGHAILKVRKLGKESQVAFKVFEKGSAPIQTVPSITIQKRGLISMNRAAHSLIGSAEAVELLWDEERRVIGLRPTEIGNVNGYPVRPQVTNSSKGPLLIAGNLFTKFIGLDTSEARRWTPKMEDEVLCIDVSTPGGRVNSNRRRGDESKATSAENANDAEDDDA
jgi:hypothetical protein